MTFSFLLFVAGDTPNSAQALGNLTALCRERIPEQYEINLIDVFLEPERALAEGVFMTPTLIVEDSLPQKRIVGTLSNPEVVAQALGLNRPFE